MLMLGNVTNTNNTYIAEKLHINYENVHHLKIKLILVLGLGHLLTLITLAYKTQIRHKLLGCVGIANKDHGLLEDIILVAYPEHLIVTVLIVTYLM